MTYAYARHAHTKHTHTHNTQSTYIDMHRHASQIWYISNDYILFHRMNFRRKDWKN